MTKPTPKPKAQRQGWSRPELVKLGTIKDIAAVGGAKQQGMSSNFS